MAKVHPIGKELTQLRRLDRDETTDPGNGARYRNGGELAGLLGLLAAGADGQAATELTSRLGLAGTQDTAIGALLNQLASASDVQLDVANSVWTNQGVDLQTPFSTFVHDTHHAETDTVPLGLPEGADASPVTVLLNAVHFKGTWTTEFDPTATRSAPFTLADHSTIDVPWMSLNLTDGTRESSCGDSFSLLRLPYGTDQRFAMEFILPNDVVDMYAFFKGLDVAAWQSAQAALTPSVESMSVPTFTTTWMADLKDSLDAVSGGVTATSAPAPSSSTVPSASPSRTGRPTRCCSSGPSTTRLSDLRRRAAR